MIGIYLEDSDFNEYPITILLQFGMWNRRRRLGLQ